jgi:hypothetical protein
VFNAGQPHSITHTHKNKSRIMSYRLTSCPSASEDIYNLLATSKIHYRVQRIPHWTLPSASWMRRLPSYT